MARARSPSPPPENAIEPASLRPQPEQPSGRPEKREDRSREGAIRAESSPAAATPRKNAPAGPAVPSGPPRDTSSVPDSVRDRFLQIKEKWYFENGDLAFQDMGTKLSTKSENQEIVRSFVAIAKARGWEEINVVEGTKEFRRAIWHEASLQNIPVRGFTPTDLDEARLVQTMARRREAERQAQHPLPLDAPDASDSGAPRSRPHRRERGERNRETDPAASMPADKPKRVLYGTLLAHGAENFQFNPQEDMSYYVKLRTDKGEERVLWGTDLYRALKESLSKAKVGDRIGVMHLGEQPVTVPKEERDSTGRVVKEYDLATHRNSWAVEKAEFFQEREQLARLVRDRSVDAKRAVGVNPALAGTYVALRGAEEYAKKNFTDPHEQNRFVDVVRRTLARDIKHGAPLYTPALRDRQAANERAAARAHSGPEMSPLR